MAHFSRGGWSESAVRVHFTGHYTYYYKLQPSDLVVFNPELNVCGIVNGFLRNLDGSLWFNSRF